MIEQQPAASRIPPSDDRSGPDEPGERLREQLRSSGQEAVRQGDQIAHDALSRLREQAQESQRRATDGLRTLADELSVMAERSKQTGMATGAVRRAGEYTEDAARWLDEREPGELVEEVRGFARRHPAGFLLGAAAGGLLVGRLVNRLTDGGSAQRTRSRPESPRRESPRPVPAEQAPPPSEPHGRERGPSGGRGPSVDGSLLADPAAAATFPVDPVAAATFPVDPRPETDAAPKPDDEAAEPTMSTPTVGEYVREVERQRGAPIDVPVAGERRAR